MKRGGGRQGETFSIAIGWTRWMDERVLLAIDRGQRPGIPFHGVLRVMCDASKAPLLVAVYIDGHL